MRLAMVSAFPPQPLGSAIFAGELCEALSGRWPVAVCAVGPRGTAYEHPVTMTVDEDRRGDYRTAGAELATSDHDLVLIQHDLTVPRERHLLDLVGELRPVGVPYALALHSVPSTQRADERRILTSLCDGAARVITFTGHAERLLHLSGIAQLHRTAVLRPGAPRQLRKPFHPRDLRPPVVHALRRLRATQLLTTLGQDGPDGGLEFVVAALRAVAERHPRAALLLVRPAPRDRADARSRRKLGVLAGQLGVLDRVQFLDLYLTAAELCAVLARTDVFLSPYQNPERDRSGPLTCALAAGCPVVTTGYRYAIELFATAGDPPPGLVVPCGSVEALSGAIDRLLAGPADLAAARAGANALGAQLTWDTAGPRHAEVLVDAMRRAATAAILRAPGRKANGFPARGARTPLTTPRTPIDR